LATEIIRRGAQDFTHVNDVSQLEFEYLVRSSITRNQTRYKPGSGSKPSPIQQARHASVRAPHIEQRQHARYHVTKTVFAVPVLPDGGPAQSHSAEGFSVDVSEGGLLFEIQGINRLPTRHMLVGVEAQEGKLHYATVEVRRQDETVTGLRIGAQFASEARDVIRHANFDPVTSRFKTGLPPATLQRWVEFGILTPVLVDHVLVCPQCRALPSFRRSCRMCGTVRVASPQLIHHFACANVGYLEDYQSDDRIICPKCRSQDLMVGADFEYLNGPYTCLECKWQDNELESVAKCLGCQALFPAHQAVEEELIGYHVNRLDPLVLLNSV